MTRPWRLTRRQRVEMEAALARLRSDVAAGTHRYGPCASTGDGWRLLCGSPIDPYVEGMVKSERDAEDRVQTIRVAIALRAALRADEDARCEEAVRAVGGVIVRLGGWDAGYHAGVEQMREWDPLPWRSAEEVVPLALWEVMGHKQRAV